MKFLPLIAGALLGLAFVVFSSAFFLKIIPEPADSSPPDAPHKQFQSAIGPTGYLSFVKALEILGGVLVAIPKTRNLGLLVLGPIIINILCYHVFLMKGATLIDPVHIGIVLLTLFLLWTERRAFAKLITR